VPAWPYKASVTVYKMVSGQRCAFSASALWDEYCQLAKDGKPTVMWQKMPYLMLAKCAEALALRKAFPAELSGVYTHEEMMQADTEAKAVESQPPMGKTFAEKFPEQAKKIQEKLTQGDSADGPKPGASPASVSDAPASLLPAGGWIVPFGKNKGQRLIDCADGDVDYLLKYYLGKLNDPANATSRFRNEWEQAVIEIRAELLARYPEVQA
jgi:hypothetical protein